MSREATAVLLIQSSWLLLISSQMFPKFGDFGFISAQIFRTVLIFAISYFPQLLSFAIVFHILLHNHEAFATIEDSLVKVVAMMTGELDTADSVILSNNTLFNKIVFVFFIMIMCIVVMNMVLGLAISDINELR